MTIRIATGTATLAMFVFLIGCKPPVASHPGVITRPPGPPAPPSPAVEASHDSTPPAAVQAEPAVATAPGGLRLPLAPAEQPSPAAPAEAASQTRIRLSAGVALPQSLPEGTQIGVSVDYRVAGDLDSSAQYFLVVSSRAGELSLPIQITREGGNLQAFCPPELRPEHKPFAGRIEQQISPGERTAVSNTEQLLTSY